MRKRTPSRAAVARSLRELSILWKKPPDPGKEKAASAGTEKRLQETQEHTKLTPDHGEPQRGRE